MSTRSFVGTIAVDGPVRRRRGAARLTGGLVNRLSTYQSAKIAVRRSWLALLPQKYKLAAKIALFQGMAGDGTVEGGLEELHRTARLSPGERGS